MFSSIENQRLTSRPCHQACRPAGAETVREPSGCVAVPRQLGRLVRCPRFATGRKRFLTIADFRADTTFCPKTGRADLSSIARRGRNPVCRGWACPALIPGCGIRQGQGKHQPPTVTQCID